MLAAVVALSGCQSILGIEDLSTGDGADANPGPSDAASPAPDASGDLIDAMPPMQPGFSVALLSSAPSLPLNGTNFLELDIRRVGGFTGEVTVALANMTSGLVAEPLQVDGDQSNALFPIGASAPLGLDQTISFDLTVTANGLPPATVAVRDALVTGRPGLLDTTFGTTSTGLASVSFGSDDCGRFYDLELDGDGNILAAGWGCGGLGGSTSALARFLPDGQPDERFSGDGLVRTSYSTGSTAESFQTYALGRQVDGRIIAIGGHRGNSSFPPELALVRYSTSGGIGDPFFGNYDIGKSRISLGPDATANERILDGLVTSDSRILAVGDVDDRLVVARATTTGDLDTSFASPTGFYTLELNQVSQAQEIIQDAQGRLLIAGFVESGAGDFDMVLVRLLEDGTPDSTFGTGGVVVTGSSVESERAAAVAVRPDGRIVLAGDVESAGRTRNLQIRQLLADGSPDLNFGNMGVRSHAIGDQDVQATDMIVTPDGRILMIGNRISGTDRGPVVARFTRAGDLDTTFDNDGILPLFIGEVGAIETITLQGNNKVLISGGNEGGSPGPGTEGIVVRLWI
ncbi:MAG: hypothetical protein Tsb0020_50630 [Haliangiales bacterium]